MKLALSQSILSEYDLYGFNVPGIAGGSTFTIREGEVLVLVDPLGNVNTFLWANRRSQREITGDHHYSAKTK